MEERDESSSSKLLKQLGIQPFHERLPWIGGDLQTLRDTFRQEPLLEAPEEIIEIPISEKPGGKDQNGLLIAILGRPSIEITVKGLVVILHGLGGSVKRQGLRRMAFNLRNAGFAVLKINLRGADLSRTSVGGTYAADCTSDLEGVFIKARALCKEISAMQGISNNPIPLFGVGISLGGTILLNACLLALSNSINNKHLIDGLVCTSSPLDLSACSKSIERFRNKFYQYWLLQRLVRQTLDDKIGLSIKEETFLKSGNFFRPSINSIYEFDASITAPRWGYKNVDDYYKKASPLYKIISSYKRLPPTLLLHSQDDPWVPVDAAIKLSEKLSSFNYSEIKVVITNKGGHNGFHGLNGCWGDQLVEKWLSKLSEDFKRLT